MYAAHGGETVATGRHYVGVGDGEPNVLLRARRVDIGRDRHIVQARVDLPLLSFELNRVRLRGVGRNESKHILNLARRRRCAVGESHSAVRNFSQARAKCPDLTELFLNPCLHVRLGSDWDIENVKTVRW